MDQNVIKAATEALIARVEMGLVDPHDMWQMIAAASEELESKSDLVAPEVHQWFSMLVGAIMTNATYERLHMVEHGNYFTPMFEYTKEEV